MPRVSVHRSLQRRRRRPGRRVFAKQSERAGVACEAVAVVSNSLNGRSLLRVAFGLGVLLGGALGPPAVARALTGVAGGGALDGLFLRRVAVAGGAAEFIIQRPPPVMPHARLHEPDR